GSNPTGTISPADSTTSPVTTTPHWPPNTAPLPPKSAAATAPPRLSARKGPNNSTPTTINRPNTVPGADANAVAGSIATCRTDHNHHAEHTNHETPQTSPPRTLRTGAAHRHDHRTARAPATTHRRRLPRRLSPPRQRGPHRPRRTRPPLPGRPRRSPPAQRARFLTARPRIHALGCCPRHRTTAPSGLVIVAGHRFVTAADTA